MGHRMVSIPFTGLGLVADPLDQLHGARNWRCPHYLDRVYASEALVSLNCRFSNSSGVK